MSSRVMVSVKDHGGIGNGVANDTRAVDAAIAAANAGNLTLYFPDGTWLITPGGLMNDIKCNVYGPNAILRSATTQDSPLIRINYQEGEGNAFRSFHIRQLYGDSYYGHGLYIKYSDYSRFTVSDIRFFRTGIYLDGSTNDSHIGVNDFVIETLFACQNGIMMNSGSQGDYWCEDNRFLIAYSQGHKINAILLGNGAYTTPIHNNVFDIMSMEVNQPGANGVHLATEAERNEFTIRGGFGGAQGGGRDIITNGNNNRFQLSDPNWDKITSTGADIWDTLTSARDNTGRSQIAGATSPKTGAWRIGDVCWNNASAFPNGWRCVVAGTPGTWVALNNSTITPASSSAAGVAGMMSWDDNYVYVCTATNTWKRAALASW
jgi:Pectate lyase superfamily protein